MRCVYLISYHKINISHVNDKKNVDNCGPRISAQCVSHSNGELDFYLKNDLVYKIKNDLESPFCGPRISVQCVSHSNGELDFDFEKK